MTRKTPEVERVRAWIDQLKGQEAVEVGAKYAQEPSSSTATFVEPLDPAAVDYDSIVAKALEDLKEKLRARLSASASGYVRASKFPPAHRKTIALMIESGEVEVFDSELGRAYRLKGA